MTTTIIVPCYNEERRLKGPAFVELAVNAPLHLLFVDDGSTDGTAKILADLAGHAPGIEFMQLDKNAGKAEAIRRGLLTAVDAGNKIVGYYDADLATPPRELLRLIRTLADDERLEAVFGARVSRLGSRIVRKRTRHYLGRVYGTLASMALGVSIYDTQCGAKVFRVTPTFRAAIARPFRSSWSFDVELCDRLIRGTYQVPGVRIDALLEVPLDEWRDVAGSKFRVAHGFRAVMDLALMRMERLRRHQGGAGSSPEAGC